MAELDVQIKIGGEAGFGIMASGLLLGKTLTRAGYWVFSTNEYPSLVRGGHNLVTLRVSDREVFSPRRGIDILIAFNKETVDLHKNELTENSVLIAEIDQRPTTNDQRLIRVPFLTIAKEEGASILRNTVALGAVIFVLGIDPTILEAIIAEIFKTKGQEIIDKNIKAVRRGFKEAKKQAGKSMFSFGKRRGEEKIIVSGNEAIGLGVIASKVGFVSIYPMTPINPLLAFLADKSKDYGFVFEQPEDEIAGVNMAIGASYAGKRSMVATSGGGFSLMVEAYGLAAMIETPLVVILGTRPGPSTGLATWTDQGDLNFARFCGQGDFPHFILAAGDVEEAFKLTVEAFNLADRYQTPVILLVDKYLCESYKTVPKGIFSKKILIDQGKMLNNGKIDGYKRYQLTADGISPRAIPGQTYFITNSYEHDEYGFATEDPDIRNKMMEKRDKKRKTAQGEFPGPQFFGSEDASLSLVGWGSSKGPILEAMRILKQKGQKVNFLHFSYLNPFSENAVRTVGNSRELIDIEGNITAQFAGILKEKTGKEAKTILKYDGRPFFPEDIIENLKQKDGYI